MPRIAITVGDPGGIGPEIAARAAADPALRAVCEPVVYGPTGDAAGTFTRGRPSAEAGRAAFDAIVEAVADAREGKVAAVVTAPISKEAFRLAGLPWRGHTELLAHLTGASDVAMMFHSDALRVILATTHIPLRDVAEHLSPDRLDVVIALATRELPRFGFVRPRLAVAGLNPHAGEHGLMGDEDDRVIAPAVERARRRGLDVSGPWPADTIFLRASRGEFDAVVACYHDQGLIPMKLVSFGRAVNVTLGLPIVRTSVDHGTAFDIAGTGRADPSSLIQAALLAVRLSARAAP